MSPVEQHLATRSAAGLFDFSFMGLYEFKGPPPGQTRDLSALGPGRAAYTLLLNDDGSVFNDATVWNMGRDRWWIFTGWPKDVAWFGKHARDRSGEHAILALQGPRSGFYLSGLIGEQVVRDLRYFRFTIVDGMVVARLGYSGELGYELLVPKEDEGRLRDRLKDVPACSFEAANSLRIESGYVLFEREIDGRANPAELGLERFAPGRFEVRRKLVGLEIAEGKASGELLAASVTSQCDSPTLGKGIALGFAPPGSRPGDYLRVDNDYLGRVVPLPFYDRERLRPRADPLQITPEPR